MDNNRNNCFQWKNSPHVSPKKHLKWLTLGPHAGTLGGSFAAGTLYTHIYVSTNVHFTYTCKHYEFGTAF